MARALNVLSSKSSALSRRVQSQSCSEPCGAASQRTAQAASVTTLSVAAKQLCNQCHEIVGSATFSHLFNGHLLRKAPGHPETGALGSQGASTTIGGGGSIKDLSLVPSATICSSSSKMTFSSCFNHKQRDHCLLTMCQDGEVVMRELVTKGAKKWKAAKTSGHGSFTRVLSGPSVVERVRDSTPAGRRGPGLNKLVKSFSKLATPKADPDEL